MARLARATNWDIVLVTIDIPLLLQRWRVYITAEMELKPAILMTSYNACDAMITNTRLSSPSLAGHKGLTVVKEFVRGPLSPMAIDLVAPWKARAKAQ